MRKIVFLFIFLIFCFSIWGDLIKNQDKPLKGEWDFNLQKEWAVQSAGKDILVRGSSIQVDEEGNVYLMERKHTKIFVFDSKGTFLYSFGKKGEGPGEYKMAFNMTLQGDKIIVPDMGKFHFFTKKGEYVKSIIAGRMIFPRAFIDEDRFIHVQEQSDDKKETNYLKLYNLKTKKSEEIGKIEAEKILVASSGGMTIALRIPQTTSGIVVGAKDSKLYFGKSDKYQIKKTDLKGKEIFSFLLEGRKRKIIPMAFKRKRIERVKVNGAKMPKEMIDQMVKGIPDEAPFFTRILIDKNGLILVFVADPENENGREIDIFSPEGKYLYHSRLQLPDSLSVRSSLTFKGDYFYVFAEDEEGEGKLMKFRIDNPKI